MVRASNNFDEQAAVEAAREAENLGVVRRRDDDDDDGDGSHEEESLGTSSHGNSSNVTDPQGSGKDGKEEDRSKRLVWRETLNVWQSKALVFTVIIMVAIAGTVVTYYLVQKNQDRDFSLTFQTYAKEIGDASTSTVIKSFSVVQALSKTITNMQMELTASFPFYTHPNYAVIAGTARRISQVDAIALCPLVPIVQQKEWEAYSKNHSEWLAEGLAYRGLSTVDPGPIPDVHFSDLAQHAHIEGLTSFGDYFLPLWQIADAPTNASIINYDLFSRRTFQHIAVDVVDGGGRAILSDAGSNNFISEYSLSNNGTKANEQYGSYLMQPVYDNFETTAKIKAFLIAVFSWGTYFDNVLLESVSGIVVVVSDRCGSEFTYMINGRRSVFLGSGDRHESVFDQYRFDVDFANFAKYDGPPHAPFNGTSYDQRFNNTPLGHCDYLLSLYPSSIYSGSRRNEAGIYAAAVAGIFAIIFSVLVIYDIMVTKRQNRLMATAKKTDAIVASLFPKEIKDKMLAEAADNSNPVKRATTTKCGLEDGGAERKIVKNSKPIADLFPDTTIFFADIAGFTAWSSAREPAQVFTLLENIYHAFDQIAETRRVFKVETVGDCYVAATGLPVPRKDHAVVMARFARDCSNTFSSLVKTMEMQLGPDTADLGLRVGLHSGPVTAGVLRGERSRFQLFGDTVNTASRMETNGMRDRIHISQETADILVEAGKGHWLVPRSDKVHAKGKGELQTYWLEIKSANTNSTGSSSVAGEHAPPVDEDDDDDVKPNPEVHAKPIVRKSDAVVDLDDERQQRLIDWNTDCLLRFLKEIEARRQISTNEGLTQAKLRELEQRQLDCPLEEVQEIIVLPTWEDHKTIKDVESIDLGTAVTEQLRDYIQTIAAMYRKTPFHNFEHASHVSMSVIKLLARIVAPPNLDPSADDEVLHNLHDHTYGITSDPLIQFACAFSALIHDVDHSGVPNTQLIKEKSKLAAVYNNKSVAEQNSVDLAWALLMDDSYTDLRRAIYHDETEFKRFRQLVVNSVMATDIMDKDLKTLRNNRWDRAFKEEREESALIATNRKATIVIEHLIQASDVAHTMQHWHIYRKWNERFFTEMYKAYVQGRSDTNPVDNWYKGEIGFFDFYIIPLAKKLKDCGVFGVSSDEYLNYAQKNRKEWELKGQEVVESMIEKVKALVFDPPPPVPRKSSATGDTTSSAPPASSSAQGKTVADELIAKIKERVSERLEL